jgi:AmiR/NasT family two-component response regulator
MCTLWNVPKGKEGIAVKADERLQHLPIVVLTTFSAEADILKMYEQRCNSYIVKPVKYERLTSDLHLNKFRLGLSPWVGSCLLFQLPNQQI